MQTWLGSKGKQDTIEIWNANYLKKNLELLKKRKTGVLYDSFLFVDLLSQIIWATEEASETERSSAKYQLKGFHAWKLYCEFLEAAREVDLHENPFWRRKFTRKIH